MQSNFDTVVSFHRKFGLEAKSKPQLLDTETYNFRLACLNEELNEFKQANYDENLPEAVDALVDLVVFAIGTADCMGVSEELWQEVWQAVYEANMSKVKAVDASQSNRKSSLDIVKPAGWTKPDVEGIVAKYLI